jgi:hypothetical protein
MYAANLASDMPLSGAVPAWKQFLYNLQLIHAIRTGFRNSRE